MQESFYPVYNSVQNTPKMNQELDPNFKMFSLFYAYLSDNKRYISESLLVPYMTKSLILDFFFATIVKWNCFWASPAPLCVERWGVSSVSRVHWNKNLETVHGRLYPPLQKLKLTRKWKHWHLLLVCKHLKSFNQRVKIRILRFKT